MTPPQRLYLYEEIMLLALRDQKGTLLTSNAEYAVAGAVLAELLLDRRIAVDGASRGLVDVRDAGPTGDPLLPHVNRRRLLRAWPRCSPRHAIDALSFLTSRMTHL